MKKNYQIKNRNFTLLLYSIFPVLLIVSVALLVGFTASAQSNSNKQSIDLDGIESGQLLIRTASGLSSALLLSTKIEINVAGTISRTKVSQRFINTADEWAEGIYVFPISEKAAVDTLKMRIGEKFIEGFIKEKKQAKEIYETAKKEGRKAALVEQQRPNLFTNSVANIAPNEIVVVQIEFQNDLSPNNGYWEIRVPLVVAPRYEVRPIIQKVQFGSSGWATISTEPINIAQKPSQEKKDLLNGEIQNPVEISINLEPGFDLGTIDSPYHDVLIQKVSSSHHKIRLKGPVPSDKDFLLKWTSDGDDIQASLFNEKHNGLEHFLLIINPPQELNLKKTQEREIIFIQDISGSMSGESIQQSKVGLEMALRRLKSTDRFNLVFFNNGFWSYASNPVLATPLEVQRAVKAVRNLKADGGTEMYQALNFSLDNFSETRGVLKQLIFLTDGGVQNENTLFTLISKKLKNTRLFTIGIGSAPNSYFMSRAAELGRGAHVYIGQTSEVSARMQELFLKIENPAITDLVLKLPINTKAEYYPNPLPDLYFGEPLAIAIKGLKAEDIASIVGKKGKQDWEIDISLKQSAEHIGVAKLWARKKIANIERSLITQNASTGFVEKNNIELLSTALSYGLVSRLSSLVAVDVIPSRPKGAKIFKSTIEPNFPHGWDMKIFAVEKDEISSQELHRLGLGKAKIYKASLNGDGNIFELPQTALNWKLTFSLSIGLLVLGFLSLQLGRRRKHV